MPDDNLIQYLGTIPQLKSLAIRSCTVKSPSQALLRAARKFSPQNFTTSGLLVIGNFDWDMLESGQTLAETINPPEETAYIEEQLANE